MGRVYKKVLSGRTDSFILCAWDECDRDGYEQFKVIVRDGGDEGLGADSGSHYVFCSERHKEYWINSTVKYGNFRPGMGSTLIPK